jgi:hypothetical protein
MTTRRHTNVIHSDEVRVTGRSRDVGHDARACRARGLRGQLDLSSVLVIDVRAAVVCVTSTASMTDQPVQCGVGCGADDQWDPRR